MLTAFELKPTDRVSEIGTGSGYEVAVLSRIVQTVFRVKREAELAHYAQKRLAQLGYTNVWLHQGGGLG